MKNILKLLNVVLEVNLLVLVVNVGVIYNLNLHSIRALQLQLRIQYYSGFESIAKI